MAQAHGLGFGLPFCAATGGAAAPLASAPYYDDFAGAAASLNGRAVLDKAWAPGADDNSTADSLRLDGAGHLVGRQAGSWFFTTMELDTGNTAGKWWRAELSATVDPVGFNGLGSYFFIHHSVPSPNTQASTRFAYDIGGDIIELFYAINGANNGGGTELLHTNTDSAGRGVYARPGDVLELRQKTVGGQVKIEPYHNGQQIGPEMRIDTLGVTLNGVLALRGTLPANGELDAIQIGDPAMHAMLSVYVPRVPQLNADGSVGVPVTGDYTGPSPSGLTYTLYDAATGTTISGHVDQPLASFATGAARTASSAGSYSGRVNVAPGVIGAGGAYLRIKRSGLAGGAVTLARSCVFTPGQVVLMYGQSLTMKMWAQGWSGLTFTPPAHAWTVDGSLDNNGVSSVFPITAINRKTRPVNGDLESGLTTAYIAYSLNQAAGGDKPLAMIRGGMGGTYYHERLPSDPGGLGIWSAALDGVRLAGGDVAWVFDCAGEYEAQGATGESGYQLAAFGGAEQAQVVADIQAIYDALDAQTGRACKVVVRPVGAVFTAADARCEAMRRLQWKLTQDFPSRYVLGGYGMDQQHDTATDQYHLATYQEQGRRLAWAMAKAMGLAAFDRCGPRLVSVTAWSTTSVTVRFDKNGASALEVVNTTGALTDYRGGLTFATDSGFTAEKVPTAVGAPVNIDATFAEITWTFAAGAFPTKPYVRGPYGANPFNRTNNTTVNGAIQTQGSMVRGVFTGEDQNIPVQPYYSPGGDYIVGS